MIERPISEYSALRELTRGWKRATAEQRVECLRNVVETTSLEFDQLLGSVENGDCRDQSGVIA